MKLKKTIKYKKQISFLNTVQYVIAAIIAILFGLNSIPFYNYSFSYGIITAIVVQILISIVRLRVLNIIFNLILLFFGVLSLLLFVGPFFGIIGLLLTLIDMASYKNYKLYKQVEIRTFGQKPKKKKKFESGKVYDVDYEEK